MDDFTGTGLQIEAMTSLGGGVAPTAWILLLAGGLFLLALWSALSHTRPPSAHALRGPAVRNLFLGVRIRSAGSGDFTGHVMAMDLRSVLLVSPCALPKGERLRIALDSLPGYTGASGELEAEVVGHRELSGEPPSHLLKLRLGGLVGNVRASFIDYLHALAGGARLSRA